MDENFRQKCQNDGGVDPDKDIDKQSEVNEIMRRY